MAGIMLGERTAKRQPGTEQFLFSGFGRLSINTEIETSMLLSGA